MTPYAAKTVFTWFTVRSSPLWILAFTNGIACPICLRSKAPLSFSKNGSQEASSQPSRVVICLTTKAVFKGMGLKTNSSTSGLVSDSCAWTSKIQQVKPLVVFAKTKNASPSSSLMTTEPGSPTRQESWWIFWSVLYSVIKNSKHTDSSNWVDAEDDGQKWAPDLCCISCWNCLLILWVLGLVRGAKDGIALADAMAISISEMLMWGVCLLCKILASMHAFILWTLDRWLCLDSLKVSFALWCVFSTQLVSPRWWIKALIKTSALEVWSNKSLSLSK